ncbi:MAG: S8 family serine peptidase [Paracoccus sp. (in: a-proteobacteria)]|nr:S8 family serine peptidase [Paracoccus sp. (in: a-proteobacteria)]
MGARVGIVDSGGPAAQMAGARSFTRLPVAPDHLGHGSAVAGVIARAAPDARLIHAQVFADRPVTNADAVAQAVDWLAPQCDIVVLSLGLAADRAALCDAVAAAQTRAVLVASSPARGRICWPAAYPGVVAATGDARCGWDELSSLPGGIIGAWCGSPEQGGSAMGGASLAAARVVGHLADAGPAAWVAPLDWLHTRAAHHGAERRTG